MGVPSLSGSCFEHEGLNEIGELPLDLQGRVFLSSRFRPKKREVSPDLPMLDAVTPAVTFGFLCIGSRSLVKMGTKWPLGQENKKRPLRNPPLRGLARPLMT